MGYELFQKYLGHYSRQEYLEATAVAREILAELERANSPYRDDEILFFLGNGFATAGDYDTARNCYQASFTLARQRYDRTRLEARAVEEERRFLQLTSVLANNTAVLEYAQGNPVQAAQTLRGAAGSPVKNDVLEQNRRAMAEWRTELQLQEIQGQARPVPLNQDLLAQQWRREGAAAFQSGHFAEALPWFAAVCSTAAAGLQDKYDLGMALMRLGRPQEALACFVQVLQTDPTVAMSYVNVGTALAQLGDPAGAEQFLLQARAFDGTLPELGEQLAAVARLKAESGKAEPEPAFAGLGRLLQLCRPPRLSLCLIVKDEAQSLAACLRSAQPVVEELIVVDTGSSDQTVAIAEGMGARVCPVPWSGDFAAARNEALRQATGDWILILDADEQLDPGSYTFLRALIARTPIAAQRPQCFAPLLVNHRNERDIIYSYQPRLYPRLPELKYHGRIQERLPVGVPIERVVELAIHHHGYDAAAMSEGKRWQRNRELCRQIAAEEPENHLLEVYLGNLQMQAGEWQAARATYESAVGQARERGVALDGRFYIPDSLSALARCCQQLNEPEAALHYAGQGLQIEGDHPTLLITQGQLLFQLGRYDEALASYDKALKSRNQAVGRSQLAWLPLMGTADIYARRGQVRQAQELYQQALTVSPDNPLVLTRLANLSSYRPLLQMNEALLPAQVTSWRKSGYQAASAGDYVTALSWFKMVVATPFADARDYHQIGEAYQHAGNYQEALAAALHAIRLAPAHATSCNYAATALYKLGDVLTARRFFQRAVVLNPFLQDPRNNLKALKNSSRPLTRRELSRNAAPHRYLRALLKEPVRHPRLSLCMIVKNEETCLAECLQSVQPVVDEMIVVDTGSTDTTVAIAESFGARVFHFPWTGSFSAARNESLNHASGDWILILDADERLRPVSYGSLRDLIALASVVADDIVGYVLRIVSTVDSKGQDVQEHYTLRLFPNLPQLRFSGYIHEQLSLAGKQLLIGQDIVIDHIGYQPAHMIRQGKASRNLELSLKAVADEPENAFHYFNLGQVYLNRLQYQQALEQFQQALTLQAAGTNVPMVWTVDAYDSIASCLLYLQRPAEAVDYCRQGLQLNPEHAGMWISLGQAYLNQGEFELALAGFEKAHSLVGVDAGVGYTSHRESTWLALFGIGQVHACQGRVEPARRYFEQALALNPQNGAIQAQLDRLPVQQPRP